MEYQSSVRPSLMKYGFIFLKKFGQKLMEVTVISTQLQGKSWKLLRGLHVRKFTLNKVKINIKKCGINC